MSEIRQWLDDLGLGEYGDAFEAAAIDRELLADLDHQLLKDIGVSVVGHRMKLLKAIAAMDAEAGAPAEGDAPTGPAAAKPDQPPLDAERRQLTVMFCDMVGSTALSEKLDPEDLREVMRAYQDACAGAIMRFDGFIAQTLGDGLMVYFGYPNAHEDDAERAVRAGLAMVESVAETSARLERDKAVRLAVRIGIHTGLVVAGEVGAADTRGEAAMVGEAPNVAARIEALADPGTVLLSAATRRLIGGAFELEPLGVQALKGIAEPMAVYRALGDADTASRFEAAHTAGLTPLVGREIEIDLLMDRWQRAKDGEGQVVLLCGEAGIGKSRLIETVAERLAGEEHLALRHQCSPYHTNTAFHAISSQFARSAGFARDDTAEQKLDKLEAHIRDVGLNVEEAAPLFAFALSIPVGGRYPPLNMSPQRQKQRTIDMLNQRLMAASQSMPILFMVEDAHWGDASSMEALGRIVEFAHGYRILALISFRPEYQPPWGARPYITPLAVGRLSRRQGAALVEKVTGGKAVPPAVLDEILAKTEGVPLFVEELTKTVLEAGFASGDGGRPALPIPTTLQDSLIARLDRLGPIREVAQTAACIGREFSYHLLASITPLSGKALEESLTALINSELVFVKGTPPDAIYTFKHALVQDAAYQSLLKSKRQNLHLEIARMLEETSRGDDDPEVAAGHFALGGDAAKAAHYLYLAAEHALDRGALSEAAQTVHRALDTLSRVTENSDRMALEMRLRAMLAVALVAIEGWRSDAAEQAYERALRLAEALPDPAMRSSLLYRLATLHEVRGEFRETQELLAKRTPTGSPVEDKRARVETAELMACSTFHQGHFKASLGHAEDGLAHYDSKEHVALLISLGENPAVGCHTWAARSLWFLGYPQQALAKVQVAIELASEASHAFALAQAEEQAALLRQHRREPEAVVDHAGRAIALGEKFGFPYRIASATIVRGWALSMQGDHQAGLADLRAGLLACEATGALIDLCYFLALYAEALGRAGDIAAAHAAIDRAWPLVERGHGFFYTAELLRLRALLYQRAGEAPKAMDTLSEALDVARTQGAKTLELRGATSLARLWQDQAKSRQARDLLAPIYDGFTEGFEIADLREAKALLAAVEGH